MVDKIGAPVILLSVAFFGFSRSGFLAGIFGSKKSGRELTCWTPYIKLVLDVSSSYGHERFPTSL